MALSAPTKGNLTAAKRSRALASDGYELMDKKRNILIREIMTRMDEAAALQAQIDAAFADAYASLRMAQVYMGGSAGSGAEAIPIDTGIELRFKSVMGVELPYVADPEEDVDYPPYGLAFTCSELDDAYFKFRDVKRLLRTMAETENAIYRFAYAIKKSAEAGQRPAKTSCTRARFDISRIADALEEKKARGSSCAQVVKEQKTPGV